jgi:adenylate cyclase
MIELVVGPGRADERRFSVKPDGGGAGVTIGRTKENDVWVLHGSLSRQHARLEWAGGKLFVVDLGSKNGTYVNGERIQRREVSPGDTVRCGDVSLVLVDDARRAAGAVPLGATPSPTSIFHSDRDVTRLPIEGLIAPQGGSLHKTSLRLPTVEPVSRAQGKLEILLKVSQLLSSPRDVDSLLREVLDLIFLIMDIDRAAVLMVDGASGELVPRVVKSSRPGPVPDRFYSAHIVEFVKERGVAALFADAQLDPRLGQARSIISQSIFSSMCAPLKPRDKLLGVLYVDNLSAPDRFTPEDLEFLGAFASQAAVAIDNADLYRRLEEEAVLRSRLTRFFSPATAAKLAATKGGALDVVETEVTALFSDISGFTSMSARMRPRQVIDMLNDYFPPMADIVFKRGGTLEKYIGDALMAVWGAPFAGADDADRAVLAAAEMQQTLATLNVARSGRGLEPIRIHVGINTGIVAAGNIGSERYLQYATLGDATNVASRVCDAAPAGEILVSESTRQRLTSAHFPLETLGPVPLKGRDEPLVLHRLRWDVAPEAEAAQKKK